MDMKQQMNKIMSGVLIFQNIFHFILKSSTSAQFFFVES